MGLTFSTSTRVTEERSEHRVGVLGGGPYPYRSLSKSRGKSLAHWLIGQTEGAKVCLIETSLVFL